MHVLTIYLAVRPNNRDGCIRTHPMIPWNCSCFEIVWTICYDKLQAQVVAPEQFQTSRAKKRKHLKHLFVWLTLTCRKQTLWQQDTRQTALVKLLQSAMAEDKRVPWRSSVGQFLKNHFFLINNSHLWIPLCLFGFVRWIEAAAGAAVLLLTCPKTSCGKECVKVVIRCRPMSRQEESDNREKIVEMVPC